MICPDSSNFTLGKKKFFYNYKFIYFFNLRGNMILDGAGGECTAMWWSYHPSYLIKQGVPEKFLIGEVLDYIPFYSFKSDFYMKV